MTFRAIILACVLLAACSQAIKVEKPLVNIPSHRAPTATGGKCGVVAPTPTLVFDKSCTTINGSVAKCWVDATDSKTHRVPAKTDVISFPKGTNALYGTLLNLTNATAAYTPLVVRGVVVEAGAIVRMTWGAWEITECAFIAGRFQMNQTANQAGYGPAYLPVVSQATDEPFPHDPSVPQNTDCARLPVGFTPRLCGPGQMVVAYGANFTMLSPNSYSSVFIQTEVRKGGLMWLKAGLVWSNVTNYGRIVADGVYLHGFIYNMMGGLLEMGLVWYDVWSTVFNDKAEPVLIVNYGTALYTSDQHTTIAMYGDGSNGNYRSMLINYNNATFYVEDWDDSGIMQGDEAFDIINFGDVLFSSQTTWESGGFSGLGTFVNHGRFITNGVSVSLSSYFGEGGKLITKGGGSFYFGNGAVNAETLKLCSLQRMATAKKPEPKKDLATPPLKADSDGCWWYGQWCYPAPYLWSAPSLSAEKTKPKIAGADSIDVVLQAHIDLEKIPSPCSTRYSLKDTVIEGDGKGSVASTVPIEVSGKVRVANGGRLFALAEHKQSPVGGAGEIIVAKGGAYHIGIEADFNQGGKLTVLPGGLVHIPKHARVAVTNYTVDVRLGGRFHLDGQLETNRMAEPIRSCGTVDGIGRASLSKDSDFKCF